MFFIIRFYCHHIIVLCTKYQRLISDKIFLVLYRGSYLSRLNESIINKSLKNGCVIRNYISHGLSKTQLYHYGSVHDSERPKPEPEPKSFRFGPGSVILTETRMGILLQTVLQRSAQSIMALPVRSKT